MSRSPQGKHPSATYRTAWAAITELIHGESSWSGRERNVAYLNQGDGRFSDVSGATGLDFLDDSRAFATGDFDGDGDVDLILKSRNEPGIRVLRNDLAAASDGTGNNAITVRLRGKAGNPDAVGARVTVLAEGRASTKVVSAGQGFLSQHSKTLIFGIGKANRADEVRIAWPSGGEDVVLDVGANRLVHVLEGSGAISVVAHRPPGRHGARASPSHGSAPDRSANGIWLVDPLIAPSWSLSDLNGVSHSASDYMGSPFLLNIWATWCPPCREELRDLQQSQSELTEAGLGVVAVSVDDPERRSEVERFVQDQGLTFPVLLADTEFVSTYNLVKRHLLNRRTDLRIPTTFLVNGDGLLAKLYEGPVDPALAIEDMQLLGEPSARRLARAVPFDGRWFGPRPRRNVAEIGAALFGHALGRAAVPYLEAAVELTPEAANAHYNLATALVGEGMLADAQHHFERALEREPSFPEAHNGLGVLLARSGDREAAIAHLRAAVDSRPGYLKAIGNLATAYQSSGGFDQAVRVLESGIATIPCEAGLLNRLGSVHARRGDLAGASTAFQEALTCARGDAATLMNLALLEAQRGDLQAAAAQLGELIENEPGFGDAHVALARVHASAGETAKARAVLEKFLARRPQHEEAKALHERLGGNR